MNVETPSGLTLPARAEKPRAQGITILIDPGLPTHYFQDVVESAAPHIDLVKFGWGTSVITPQLDEKIAALREQGIDYFFGGTLFEKFYRQRQVGAFVEYCRSPRLPLCRDLERHHRPLQRRQGAGRRRLRGRVSRAERGRLQG